MTGEERRAEFERAIERLIELGAQRVILFGSRALADHCVDSDFDLLVVLPGPDAEPFASRLARTCREVAPRIAIDLIAYTPAEFERLSRERHFVKNAVREGKLLHAA